MGAVEAVFAQASNKDSTNKSTTTNKEEEDKKEEQEDKNNAERLAPPKQEGQKTPAPQAYRQEDFPDWAYYAYRFGAVAVGSIPFTILFSTMMYDGYKTYVKSREQGEFANQYLPLYLSGPEKPPFESYEVVNILYITLAVSVSLSTIDLMIQMIQKNRGRTIQNLLE